MRTLIFSLIVLSCSVASAQWGYVPIEQSRSYRQIGRYSGPLYPGAAYYGRGRYYRDYTTIRQPITIRPNHLEPGGYIVDVYGAGW